MDDKRIKLIIGSLLHDCGKVLYRYSENKNHSECGYDFLKKSGLNDEQILSSVLYHHAGMLKNADVPDDDNCYITYIADNIASAIDRRDKEDGGNSVMSFDRYASSESIFNILNGNNQTFQYKLAVLDDDGKINYPVSENVSYAKEDYGRITDNIRDSIKGVSISEEYVNSLLNILQANLEFIPSSTNIGQLRDISLYQHSKLTAAAASCIHQWLDENNITDYRTELYLNAKDFYGKKVFMLYSLDMSGIQDFIYNISSKGSLKGLRARSFYLEILMEHIVDTLLTRLGLSRANVTYTGGGHTYILLPATEKCREIVDKTEKELNLWFIGNFGTGLYAAGGYTECSSEELQNKTDGSYKGIFRRISKIISEKKLHRYNADDIRKLNELSVKDDHRRECSICHRSDRLDEKNVCSMCNSFIKLSDGIINSTNSFFTVMKDNCSGNGSVLPFGCILLSLSGNQLQGDMNKDDYIRAYSKKVAYTGLNLSTRLFVGDYCAHKEFSNLANNSLGIKRLAVLRADVDNLGASFVSGFEKAGGRFETITRTSVLSEKLSQFFKHNINYILNNGSFSLYDANQGDLKRNVTIVYSGGDDVFAVGGWDDIIGFAVDLHNCFEEFTQGTLSISAGIGMFGEKYPIYAMAKESGELEEISKHYENGKKNAVTLFDSTGSYSWDIFINDVVGEKLNALKEYILVQDEHSTAMLYKMLELIREKQSGDKLNIARFAYLLARLRPTGEAATAKALRNFDAFSEKMYGWIRDDEECRKLVTAIYIHVYMNRRREN